MEQPPPNINPKPISYFDKIAPYAGPFVVAIIVPLIALVSVMWRSVYVNTRALERVQLELVSANIEHDALTEQYYKDIADFKQLFISFASCDVAQTEVIRRQRIVEGTLGRLEERISSIRDLCVYLVSTRTDKPVHGNVDRLVNGKGK